MTSLFESGLWNEFHIFFISLMAFTRGDRRADGRCNRVGVMIAPCKRKCDGRSDRHDMDCTNQTSAQLLTVNVQAIIGATIGAFMQIQTNQNVVRKLTNFYDVMHC